MRGFYFITDHTLSKQGIYKDVADALAVGVKFIQYRNKEATTKTLFEEALKLRRLCKSAKFLINDRIDIVLAVDADGVHLGQDDMPITIARKLLGKKRIIGLTVHNLDEAKEAQELGADYLAVSPIFSTSTKKDAGKPIGIKAIKEIKKHIPLPVVAIGGITLANAKEVISAGADYVVSISAVLSGASVKEEIKKFQQLFTLGERFLLTNK